MSQFSAESTAVIGPPVGSSRFFGNNNGTIGTNNNGYGHHPHPHQQQQSQQIIHGGGSAIFGTGGEAFFPEDSPSSEQITPQLNPAQMLLLNRKLTQLSLSNQTQTTTDSNGNKLDSNGNVDLRTSLGGTFSAPNPESPYDVAFRGLFDDYQVTSGHSNTDNFSPTSTSQQWKYESVEHNLRSKLAKFQNFQTEFQSNFVEKQSQYSAMLQQCHAQFSNALRRMNEEFVQQFHCQLEELILPQCRRAQEVLDHLEEKRHESSKFSSEVPNGTEESMLDKFDPDFLQMIQQILDAPLPSVEIRLPPPVDPALLDRSLRNLLQELVKVPKIVSFRNGNTGDQPNFPGNNNNGFVPYSASTPINDSGITSNSSDSTSFMNFPQNPPNGGFIPSSHHFGWQQQPNSSNFMQITPTSTSTFGPSKSGANNNTTLLVPSPISPTYLSDHHQHHHSNGPRSNGGNGSNTDESSNMTFYAHSISSNTSGTSGTINIPLSLIYHHEQHQQMSNSSNNKQNLAKSLHSKIRRDRMSYVAKFGEQGSEDGQFAEPSGVAVNSANDDIIIADANNHRIQVFDKWGKFRFHFGEGKLKFPNRVAISDLTGEIVISERPPVHQIQVYDRYGVFKCKFGAKHLRHPRGLTVDHQNRVIVVECKVMRVFIFDLRGDLLNSFDCSMHIQFPNAVAVSRQEEIFISDNRSHCVKVFNFAGKYLRQIGGQGVTNYPIGVLLCEQNNCLIVVDNYNNLNVTIFRPDGQLLAAYESSVKHQQCLDVAMLSDSSLVVTSKDLQVYIYKIKEMNSNNSNSNIQINHQQQHQHGQSGSGSQSQNKPHTTTTGSRTNRMNQFAVSSSTNPPLNQNNNQITKSNIHHIH